MQITVHGHQPQYGFFSGLHGDEWSVIPSVAKIIERYQTELGAYVFIPECSPSAVQLRTRTNAEGLDLNRSFTQPPGSQEAVDIIKALQPYTFNLCVDFHEDTEVDGVYLYDSQDIEGTPILTSFRDQIKKVASLYTGIDDETDEKLGGEAQQGYRVSSPPQRDANGNYIYEGFFDFWALIEGKTKRSITLEVPTPLSSEKKDQVIDIFFRTFILGQIV